MCDLVLSIFSLFFNEDEDQLHVRLNHGRFNCKLTHLEKGMMSYFKMMVSSFGEEPTSNGYNIPFTDLELDIIHELPCYGISPVTAINLFPGKQWWRNVH